MGKIGLYKHILKMSELEESGVYLKPSFFQAMGDLIREKSDQLFFRIKQLVEEGRIQIAQTLKATLTLPYRNIGRV